MSTELQELPDECPACGADVSLTDEERPDDDTLAALMHANVVQEHMENEHPISWYLGEKLSRLVLWAKRGIRWVKP